jgi:hypothetical protein
MQLDASRAGGELLGEAGARGGRKERREKMIDGIMASTQAWNDSLPG